MTAATSTLRKEHEAILKMLDATEAAAQRLEQGERLRPETLAGLLEFFRLFADRCHHGKEEDLLFPLLESKGLPRSGGPIGVMLSEHEQGRPLVRQMADAAEAYGGGAAEAGGRRGQGAPRCFFLLLPHI